MSSLLRYVALVLLATLAGCDSSESGLEANTFEATVSGARSVTLRGSAVAGPFTRAGETTYDLLLVNLPTASIHLSKRSLGRLTVRTYVVGAAHDDSFGGIVALGTPPYDLAMFVTVSGSVVVERVDGRDAEGRFNIVARTFEGDEEVVVEGVFRVRLNA